jgi:hypothetical protein
MSFIINPFDFEALIPIEGIEYFKKINDIIDMVQSNYCNLVMLANRTGYVMLPPKRSKVVLYLQKMNEGQAVSAIIPNGWICHVVEPDGSKTIFDKPNQILRVTYVNGQYDIEALERCNEDELKEGEEIEAYIEER